MSKDLSQEKVVEGLTGFVRERFLSGDGTGFDEHTPLLAWGILTSLNSAILLNHIAREYGVAVPMERVDEVSFRDVRSIAAMICESAETTA
ncbi:Phosphopantetheine attachment site [Sinosporangium album]|uniref:Phosphopantetheine attachment site n=1 Tax=Sinosporangium album TaxID=504805 RepID=A0A1G7ZEJ4_9ACTN|nr:phosphopantetheine-binding protein [Sinosporangium album]SDH06956.1 Phosphopantetheine attachment site [Sinosporangium album]